VGFDRDIKWYEETIENLDIHQGVDEKIDKEKAIEAASREFINDWKIGDEKWQNANIQPPPVLPVMPEIPEEAWYGHCLLLAQTRFGKTNVIRWRLNNLASQIEEGKASVVLMEPKGVLTKELLHTKWAYDFQNFIAILDPIDTKASVNIFDKGDGSDYAIQQTIARVARVLNTITTTLTPFQNDTLMYALRAMFCMDEPGSMRLLTGILRRGIKGLNLRNLPYSVEEFFTHDFKPDGSSQQVVSRLNGLVANPVMEALFAADHTTFDMFKEIQAGKLIVINAGAADNTYARFWIEQVESCIAKRFAIPFEKRIPTTFILDEAQTWISDDLHFASILDKAAEARIGMLIALHHMEQIKDTQVRGSIYTNTLLKFTAKTNSDINALCRSMGKTEPSFITTLPQYEFAYFGPGMESAIKVKFPLKDFNTFPQMTEQQYQITRERNRKKYTYVRQTTPQARHPPPVDMAALERAIAKPVPTPAPPPQPPSKSVAPSQKPDHPTAATDW